MLYSSATFKTKGLQQAAKRNVIISQLFSNQVGNQIQVLFRITKKLQKAWNLKILETKANFSLLADKHRRQVFHLAIHDKNGFFENLFIGCIWKKLASKNVSESLLTSKICAWSQRLLTWKLFHSLPFHAPIYFHVFQYSVEIAAEYWNEAWEENGLKSIISLALSCDFWFLQIITPVAVGVPAPCSVNVHIIDIVYII